MFLVVADKTNLGLEVFPSLLVSEFANMTTSLSRFSSIPRFHDFGTNSERTKSSFPWYQS
jgi:hypothetical protein